MPTGHPSRPLKSQTTSDPSALLVVVLPLHTTLDFWRSSRTRAVASTPSVLFYMSIILRRFHSYSDCSHIKQLPLDLYLLETKYIQAVINKWNSTHQLIINSHIWLAFTALSEDLNPSFVWIFLIQEVLSLNLKRTMSTHNVYIDEKPYYLEKTTLKALKFSLRPILGNRMIGK